MRRRGAWKDALRRRMLAVADCMACAVGAVTAGLLTGEASVAWATLALLPLWVLLAKGRGLYARDHVRIGHTTVDELPALFEWVTLSVALTALVLALFEPGLLTVDAAVGLGLAAFIAVACLRPAARAAWRAFVAPERTIVVGDGALADAVGRKLVLENGHHLVLAQRFELGPVDPIEECDCRPGRRAGDSRHQRPR